MHKYCLYLFVLHLLCRRAPLLAEYHQILNSLDYNYQQMLIQFKTLDDLSDITATVSSAQLLGLPVLKVFTNTKM